MAWQASTLAVLALVVGLPLGTAAGRWTWTVDAEQLGVVVQPVTPFVAIVVLVPLTIVVVNVAAAIPALSPLAHTLETRRMVASESQILLLASGSSAEP